MFYKFFRTAVLNFCFFCAFILVSHFLYIKWLKITLANYNFTGVGMISRPALPHFVNHCFKVHTIELNKERKDQWNISTMKYTYVLFQFSSLREEYSQESGSMFPNR